MSPDGNHAPTRDGAATYDALLVGGGIMSATLATLLHHVEPTWRIGIVERLDELAQDYRSALGEHVVRQLQDLEGGTPALPPA